MHILHWPSTGWNVRDEFIILHHLLATIFTIMLVTGTRVDSSTSIPGLGLHFSCHGVWEKLPLEERSSFLKQRAAIGREKISGGLTLLLGKWSTMYPFPNNLTPSTISVLIIEWLLVPVLEGQESLRIRVKTEQAGTRASTGVKTTKHWGTTDPGQYHEKWVQYDLSPMGYHDMKINI